jgi:hypothetical protein
MCFLDFDYTITIFSSSITFFLLNNYCFVFGYIIKIKDKSTLLEKNEELGFKINFVCVCLFCGGTRTETQATTLFSVHFFFKVKS